MLQPIPCQTMHFPLWLLSNSTLVKTHHFYLVPKNSTRMVHAKLIISLTTTQQSIRGSILIQGKNIWPRMHSTKFNDLVVFGSRLYYQVLVQLSSLPNLDSATNHIPLLYSLKDQPILSLVIYFFPNSILHKESLSPRTLVLPPFLIFLNPLIS